MWWALDGAQGQDPSNAKAVSMLERYAEIPGCGYKGLDRTPSEAPQSDANAVLDLEDFRNQRFKLIPNIVEGPFLVRKAVGNKVRACTFVITKSVFSHELVGCMSIASC